VPGGVSTFSQGEQLLELKLDKKQWDEFIYAMIDFTKDSVRDEVEVV
jgi:hypothetical protein